MRNQGIGLFAALLTVLGAAACSDEGELEGATDGATSATGSGGASSASTTTSGVGGAGGGGGGGCLPASVHEAYFSLAETSLCAVATYDAPVTLGYDADAGYYLRLAMWGNHGGPVTVDPGAAGAFDLVRWSAPAGASGTLTAAHTTVDAGIPEGVFLGPQALDLPFFGWTALGWTGAFPNTEGELLVAANGAKTASFAVNGFYAAAAVPGPAGQGRLVYSGLSVLGDTALGANGLYAADSCGDAASGSLLPGGAADCGAPTLVAAWGDASGPVAVDHAGAVFAVLTSFDGTQEARGFAANTIARGAPPTEGTELFTLPGFGSTLAALAPTTDGPGLLLFQPNAASDPFDALDVVAQRFTSDGDTLSAEGTPTPALVLTTPNTALDLFTDADGRLWVGVTKAPGETLFVVLDRVPPG